MVQMEKMVNDEIEIEDKPLYTQFILMAMIIHIVGAAWSCIGFFK